MRYFIILLFLVPNPAFSQVRQEIHLGISRSIKARFHPNSDLIAFAVDRKVKLYRSGIHISTLKGMEGKVQDIDFDPEGQKLLAANRKGIIRIWDVNAHEIISEFSSIDRMLATRFLKTSDKILVVTEFGFSFWNSAGENLKLIDNFGPAFRAIGMSMDAGMIAISTVSNEIRIYGHSGGLLKELELSDKLITSMAINPSNNRLAVGTENGNVHLFNLKSGQHISTLLEVLGSINSLEFSSDGKYLAVGSESLYILSMSNNRHNMVFKTVHGAVLSSSFSPDGQEVAVIEDLSPYGRIFDISDLNIPSVLRFKDQNDQIPPQIYISNPPKIVNERINFSKDLINIRGSIFDDFGIRSLAINGIETPIKENGKFIINLSLAMGDNPVYIEAQDINGNISAKRFVIHRKLESEEYDAAVARYYLFAVGIDNYAKHPNLNNGVKDVNDLAEILMNKYSFQLSDMTILKNEQATQRNIIEGLRGMIEKVTPGDNLLIYFSGHGHFDELLHEGYWIPSDAAVRNTSDYIPNTSILKIVENINSQHTLLMADACFSGSLFLNSRGIGDSYVDQVEKYRSRWGIASGRLENVSDGQVGINSPFARTLLGYLEDNKREAFAVSELVQHIKMNVPSTTGQTPIGGPLRLAEDEGGEFIFRMGNTHFSAMNPK